MTPTELEGRLQEAFRICTHQGIPLSDRQRKILLQVLTQTAPDRSSMADPTSIMADSEGGDANPLDELSPAQRQTLLAFIEQQIQQNRSWKAELLNDWLHDRSSGDLQFVRQQLGLSWLERVQSVHLAAYAEEARILKVGDRLEVSNALWEWVQEDGPCGREWFPCTVIGIRESGLDSEADCAVEDRPEEVGELPCAHPAVSDRPAIDPPLPSPPPKQINCLIRFDSGLEYEIQGMYDWNRYHWRWCGEGQE